MVVYLRVSVELQIRFQAYDVLVCKMGHLAEGIDVLHSFVDALVVLYVQGAVIAHIGVFHEFASGEMVYR